MRGIRVLNPLPSASWRSNIVENMVAASGGVELCVECKTNSLINHVWLMLISPSRSEARFCTAHHPQHPSSIISNHKAQPMAKR